jgi:hypothetical protein
LKSCAYVIDPLGVGGHWGRALRELQDDDTQSVAEILNQHVTSELEVIDRMNLNGYVPSLQSGGGVVHFMKQQLAARVPSTMMVAPLSERFVQAIERFVDTEGVDLVTFKKGQRPGGRGRVVRGQSPREGQRLSDREAPTARRGPLPVDLPLDDATARPAIAISSPSAKPNSR